MPLETLFQKSDATIAYINEQASTIDDGVLLNQFVGFCAITAATIYELAIKEIFIEFAKAKHKVFGGFVEQYFSRINGRIMYDNLLNFSGQFGAKYSSRFKNKVEQKENQYLREKRRSIKSSYGNIVTWRHQFAHNGVLPQNATLSELAKAYNDGKLVIIALQEAMKR